MHATPADFPLGGEAFAMPLGDVRGDTKSLGDFLLISFRILRPIARPGGGIDANHAPRPRAPLAELLADLARLVYRLDELFPIRFIAHRAPAARRGPHRRNERTDREILRLEFFREPFEPVIIDV